MTQFVHFGSKIHFVFHMHRRGHFDSFKNLYSSLRELTNFFRIICEKSYAGYSKIAQDHGSDVVGPIIGRMQQMKVGVHSIESLFLKIV